MKNDCYRKIESICQEMHNQLAECLCDKTIDEPTYILLSSMTESIFKKFIISFIAHIQQQQKKSV